MSKFEVEMKTTKCLKSKVPCQSDCSDKSVEPSFLSWNTNYTSKFFIIFLYKYREQSHNKHKEGGIEMRLNDTEIAGLELTY